jgi:hypothetical protein
MAWPSTKPPGRSTCSRRSAPSTSLTASPRARSAAGSIQMRMLRSRAPNICTPAAPGMLSSAGLTRSLMYSVVTVAGRSDAIGAKMIGNCE